MECSGDELLIGLSCVVDMSWLKLLLLWLFVVSVLRLILLYVCY